MTRFSSRLLFILGFASLAVVAAFAQGTAPQTYTITLVNGTLRNPANKATPTTGAYKPGDRFWIDADDAAPGKAFDKWVSDGPAIQNPQDASTIVTMPAGNLTLTATYKDFEAVRIACLGDTTTDMTNYPKNLLQMLTTPYALSPYLAKAYDVRNYGVPDTTIVDGPKPYIKQAKYTQALAFQPQVVVMLFGCQDTQQGPNFNLFPTFVKRYEDLITAFTALPSKPKVYLCLPLPIYGTGQWGMTNETLVGSIIPAIKKVAADMSVPLIDTNTPLQNHPEWFESNVHPRGECPRVIAATVFTGITGCLPPATLILTPTSVTGDNLAPNPGAEDATPAWINQGGKLAIVTAPVHSGAKAAELTGGGALGVDITAALQKAGQGDYFCAAFTCLDTKSITGMPEPALRFWLTVNLADDKGQHSFNSTSTTSNGDWTECMAILPLHWTGTLKSATMMVSASWRFDLLADDLSLVKYPYVPPTTSTPTPTPTPSTAPATPPAS